MTFTAILQQNSKISIIKDCYHPSSPPLTLHIPTYQYSLANSILSLSLSFSLSHTHYLSLSLFLPLVSCPWRLALSAFGVPISVPWYTSAKTTLGGAMYQSTYPGTKTPRCLKIVPISLRCTNQRSMYQSASSVPIRVPWYTPTKTTLGGATYQSTYPGTKNSSVS